MLASLAYFAKLTRMNVPKPASFLAAEKAAFRYLEKSNPRTSNLDFLTYGVYELIGPVRSGVLAHPSEESLLFCWKGGVAVTVNGQNATAQVVGQASRLPDRASRPRRLPHRRDALLTGGTPDPAGGTPALLPEQL